MMKRFLGASAAFCGIQVLAIPQIITSRPSSTVSLYDVLPSREVSLLNNSNLTPIDGTYQVTASILGVSSGPDGGSETTYSFGRYISQNDVFTTTLTNSQGQAVTETIHEPGPHLISNWTLVESSGGQWETFSPHVTTDATDGHTIFDDGEYFSCSYESGHQSAICTGLELDVGLATVTSGSQVATVTETRTSSVSYEGLITAFTVITQGAPVETGGTTQSNGGLGRKDLYGSGGLVAIFVVSLLSL
ncbi:hypothetical protein D9757_012227 [Collybiopsis confluens]|uniref:Uncharacterized protein n=1 Tax=Collybiopsis confluens TaxID=2823264 RepID=A0A8H5LRW7_9AGAR|nr:hypothetical protein D9757_012227 [Collybiopsis confluens]